MQINPDVAHLTTARAKELLAGDVEGYRLPLMELIERQAAEIERLEQCHREGWLYAREVEDEYQRRTGQRFASSAEHEHVLQGKS